MSKKQHTSSGKTKKGLSLSGSGRAARHITGKHGTRKVDNKNNKDNKPVVVKKAWWETLSERITKKIKGK
jgi:hypothetical protein